MGVRLVLATLTGLQLVYALIALIAFRLGVAEPIMFAGWVVLAVSQRQVICSIRRQHRILMIRRKRSAAA